MVWGLDTENKGFREVRGVAICRQSDQAQQQFDVMSQQIAKAERQCFLNRTDSRSKMKSMCLAVCHLRAEGKRNKRKGRKEQGER